VEKAVPFETQGNTSGIRSKEKETSKGDCICNNKSFLKNSLLLSKWKFLESFRIVHLYTKLLRYVLFAVISPVRLHLYSRVGIIMQRIARSKKVDFQFHLIFSKRKRYLRGRDSNQVDVFFTPT